MIPVALLRRARDVLGRGAMVETTETASLVSTQEGEEAHRALVWRVGVRGNDTYSWSVLGESTESFEKALREAARHQGGRRRK